MRTEEVGRGGGRSEGQRSRRQGWKRLKSLEGAGWQAMPVAGKAGKARLAAWQATRAGWLQNRSS